MKQENFNTNSGVREKYPASLRKPRILVAPLDWGLGHATRCIPVIYELLEQESEVWIAVEGAQAELLKQEFPFLPFINLRGYRVSYGKSKAATLWNILFKTPGIIRAIKREHEWLKKAVSEHGFDAIISDNRYGLHHPHIPSIIITHQLQIKTSLGKWSERMLQKRNYKYINQFTECWVPDEEGENNLAGELSHPLRKPDIPVKYTGSLSRFIPSTLSNSPASRGHLLIILSGPEPQRTILEEKIIRDIAVFDGEATILRGLPGSSRLVPSTNMIRFYNHLPASELTKEINKADIVISRSGYSTIMDMQRLRKKMILVPTPGQPEQEYLARYIHGKKMGVWLDQGSFTIQSALELAKNFDYNIPAAAAENRLTPVISQLVHGLRKH